jgi:DNA-binding NtrC family response regulator
VDPLICKSTAMAEVVRRIERAARADSPVLIWGEKGVGKKLVAELIHRQSRRGGGPLVIVSTRKNRAASAEDVLFGGAGQLGRLVAAEGGTLVIDEIAGLGRTGQAKLLAAAEGRHVAELEDSVGQPVDFRLMATSRSDLAASVGRRRVREDLYYRLSVVTIRVPPLRERQADIPWLVLQMIDELCAARDRPAPAVDLDLMERLTERPWPGNGHELRDVLGEMLLWEDGETLRVDHLDGRFTGDGKDSGNSSSAMEFDTLADMERMAVMRALKAHQGNRTQTARSLGISVRTLQRKLKHWDV